jgi:hypothetical protein
MFKQALIAAAICVALASCAGPFQPTTQHDIAWCRAHVAKNDLNACMLDISQQQAQPPWPEPMPSAAIPSTQCITQRNGIWFSAPCPYYYSPHW